MKTPLILTGLLLLIYGCSSTDIHSTADEVVEASLTVAVVAPVIGSYYVHDESMTTAENSSIAMNLPEKYYSEVITKKELFEKVRQYQGKFYEPWKYMGTRDGYHYLLVYPFLERRQIYRIHESEYTISEEYELTADSSRWMDLPFPRFNDFPFEYQLVPYNPFGQDFEPQGLQLIELPIDQYQLIIPEELSPVYPQPGELYYNRNTQMLNLIDKMEKNQHFKLE